MELDLGFGTLELFATIVTPGAFACVFGPGSRPADRIPSRGEPSGIEGGWGRQPIGRRGIEDSAAAQRIGPEFGEWAPIAAGRVADAPPLVEIAPKVFDAEARRERIAGGRRQRDEHIPGMAGVVHRAHPRLLEAEDAGLDLPIAPGLERRVHREHEVGARRRVVERRSQGDHERPRIVGRHEGGHGLAGKGGVRFAENEEIDLAFANGATQRGDGGGAREPAEPVPANAARGSESTVQEQRRGGRRHLRGARGKRIAGEDHGRPCRCELARDVLQPGGRDTGLADRAIQVDTGEDHAQALHGVAVEIEGPTALEDELEERHAEDAEIAVAHEGAAIGGGGGQGEPRAENHEPGSRRGLRIAESGELAGLLDRRQPGVEEIGAERQDVVGTGEIEARDRVETEGKRHRRAQGLVSERLARMVAIGAEALEPGRFERGEGARIEARHEGNAPGAARPGARQALAAERQRFIPGDGIERASGAAHEGGADPIRIVEALQRRLPARTQPPAADRMVWIALELRHPAVAVTSDHAASGGAFAAEGGVLGGDPGCRLGARGWRVADPCVAPALAARFEAGTAGQAPAGHCDPKKVATRERSCRHEFRDQAVQGTATEAVTIAGGV